MKRVLAGILLMALLMVGVAYAQEQLGNQEFNLPNEEQLRKVVTDEFLHYLKSQEKPDEKYITAMNGYNWMSWSQQQKLAYIEGFLVALSYIAQYSSFLSQPFVASAKNPSLDECAMNFNAGFLVCIIGLSPIYSLPFRTTVYLAEIDAIYSEALENRSILISDAIYIANERLNHREVNLEEWRK